MKNSFFSEIFLFIKQLGAYLLRKLKLKKSFSLSDLEIPQDFEIQDDSKRFTRQWFNKLYREIGDGPGCYRPLDTPDYDGGVLTGCCCCEPNVQLNLLPNEEKMFADIINDWDFRLADNPGLSGRKTIYCNKKGLCHGRKPFVCQIHPVFFSEDSLKYHEGGCRLPAYKFFKFHHEAIERVRRVVLKYGLEKVSLGYGRKNISKSGEETLIDFHY
jgi:hypothetical protein